MADPVMVEVVCTMRRKLPQKLTWRASKGQGTAPEQFPSSIYIKAARVEHMTHCSLHMGSTIGQPIRCLQRPPV